MTDVEHVLLTPLEICEERGCIREKDNVKIKGPQDQRKWTVQYITVFSVSLVNTGDAAFEFWTSPALPHLRSNNTEFKITPGQGSLIVSLYNFGTIIGFLLYPLIVDRIGRKYTLLLFCIPQITSWILICLAKNVIVLYLARIIGGLGYGAATVLKFMYIGEIADKSIRGFLVTISRIFFNIGMLLVFSTGAFLSYEKMNLILLFIPIMFFVTFVFMPESPHYYLKHNREEDAVKTLTKFRGTQDSRIIELEITKMREAISEEEKCKKYALRILFETKRHRKALLIATIVLVCEIFSGVKPIAAYTEDIITYTGLSTSTNSFSAKYASLTLAISITLLMLPFAPLVDYFGRRFLLLICGMICSLSLTFIGSFFFLKKYLEADDFSSISWMPLIGLIVFKLASGLGLIGTVNVIESEIFSMQIKSQALSLLHIMKQLMVFVIKLSFERSVNTFGIYGVFWLYAFSCFVLPFIGFRIMPETKGKTLEEIQILLG